MDRISKTRRSWNMSRIRGANTGPERAVWEILRSLGFQPQLNRRDLPGVPDLVLPARRIALFVHGCFWHRHTNCRFSYSPKTNTSFWNTKFRANIARDRLVRRQLSRLGWRTLVVWECELRVIDQLKARIRQGIKRAGSRSKNGKSRRVVR